LASPAEASPDFAESAGHSPLTVNTGGRRAPRRQMAAAVQVDHRRHPPPRRGCGWRHGRRFRLSPARMPNRKQIVRKRSANQSAISGRLQNHLEIFSGSFNGSIWPPSISQWNAAWRSWLDQVALRISPTLPSIVNATRLSLPELRSRAVVTKAKNGNCPAPVSILQKFLATAQMAPPRTFPHG